MPAKLDMMAKDPPPYKRPIIHPLWHHSRLAPERGSEEWSISRDWQQRDNWGSWFPYPPPSLCAPIWPFDFVLRCESPHLTETRMNDVNIVHVWNTVPCQNDPWLYQRILCVSEHHTCPRAGQECQILEDGDIVLALNRKKSCNFEPTCLMISPRQRRLISFSLSSDRAERTSFAPCSAASFAKAAPMPVEAPVIQMTFPFKSPRKHILSSNLLLMYLYSLSQLPNFLPNLSQNMRLRSPSERQRRTNPSKKTIKKV